MKDQACSVEVVSSNVSRIGWAPNVMFVTYKSGGTYEYEDVSREKFDEVATAPSVGKAINSLIKPHHPFKVVEPKELISSQ